MATSLMDLLVAVVPRCGFYKVKLYLGITPLKGFTPDCCYCTFTKPELYLRITPLADYGLDLIVVFLQSQIISKYNAFEGLQSRL